MLYCATYAQLCLYIMTEPWVSIEKELESNNDKMNFPFFFFIKHKATMVDHEEYILNITSERNHTQGFYRSETTRRWMELIELYYCTYLSCITQHEAQVELIALYSMYLFILRTVVLKIYHVIQESAFGLDSTNGDASIVCVHVIDNTAPLILLLIDLLCYCTNHALPHEQYFYHAVSQQNVCLLSPCSVLKSSGTIEGRDWMINKKTLGLL